MSAWKEYRLGNALRGHCYFKARNLKEAWKTGCRQFNQDCQSDGNVGRLVYLEQKCFAGFVPTTKWVKEQLDLPTEKRSYHNMLALDSYFWQVVGYGTSKENLDFYPSAHKTLTSKYGSPY